jgi:hypothetical protein
MSVTANLAPVGAVTGREGQMHMKNVEYVLSLILALVLLSGIAAWTHADYASSEARFSCRPGKASPAVTMKGMVVYPRCAAAKRS